MIELITGKEGFVIEEVIDFVVSGLTVKFGDVEVFESSSEYKINIYTEEDYIEVLSSIQAFVGLFGNKMLNDEFTYSLYADGVYKLTVSPAVLEPELTQFMESQGYDTSQIDLDNFLNILKEAYGQEEDEEECTFPNCNCFS